MVLSHVLPDWPTWAVNLLSTMTAALSCTLVAAYFYAPDDEKDKGANPQSAMETTSDKLLHTDFASFRRSYLSVYLIIMLADWMQGTHMYTLYLSYNVNISALFLTGFLSGAIFAPFLGSLVDKFGRKRSCIVYCVLEIIINWLEHYSDFRTLLLGRVLGGISTNLLFSAFESWMATEHRKKGFPEEWMAKTYSAVSGTYQLCDCVEIVFLRSFGSAVVIYFILVMSCFSPIIRTDSYMKKINTVLHRKRCHCHFCRGIRPIPRGCSWSNWSFPGSNRSHNAGARSHPEVGRKLW